MTTEEIICFVPRSIKVIEEVMECSDSKQFVSHAFTYFWFIIINEKTSNYVYKSANTQTQKVSYIHRISCTHSILEVVFASTLKPIPASPLDRLRCSSHNSQHCFCEFQILPRNSRARAMLQQLTTD